MQQYFFRRIIILYRLLFHFKKPYVCAPLQIGYNLNRYFMNICKTCKLLIFVFFISCKNPKEQPSIKLQNDTVQVLELAIRTAFYHESLPEIDAVKKIYYFGDSILLTSDILPLSVLPKTVDSLKFKILGRKQICLFMQTESDLSKIPNFINIVAFEKTDSSYYVSIENLNCLGLGGLFTGGGVIGMYIVKQKDSFRLIKKMSSSLN